MSARIHRLRPKRHDAIVEAIQSTLDLPLELEQATRDDLAKALAQFSPPETWVYAMANPSNLKVLLAAINAGPDSGNVRPLPDAWR